MKHSEDSMVSWFEQHSHLPDHQFPIGIGDDMAQIRLTDTASCLITTDMLLEGVHFDLSKATLKEVGYEGWMTVEAFGSALPELVATTKIWRRMYDTQEQLARDALAFMKAEWGKRDR